MSSFMPNLYYYDHKMEGYPKSDGNFIYGPLLEKKILKFLQIAKLLSNNTKNADRKPLHRFMEELKGMQIVLRSKRCWYYEDSSKCQKSKLKNSLLPLHRGQEALLDIWTFLLEFADVVPKVHGRKMLLVNSMYYIARRDEFSKKDTTALHQNMIAKYYSKLLMSTLKLAMEKIALGEEYIVFAVRFMSIVYEKFPSMASKMLEGILHATDVLTHPALLIVDAEKQDNKKNTYIAPSLIGAQKRYFQKRVLPFRSPRNDMHRRMWTNRGNDITWTRNVEPVEDESEMIKNRLELYLMDRAKLVRPIAFSEKMKTHCLATLEAVFQQQIKAQRHIQLDFEDNKFPMGDEFEMWCVQNGLTKNLELYVDKFVQMVEFPIRSAIVLMNFIPELVEHLCWCYDETGNNTIVWHAIPGYFAMIRSYFAIIRHFCRRRKMELCKDSSTPLMASFCEPTELAPWDTAELETLLDGAAILLRNTHLLNPMLQLVLEHTNLHDISSVELGMEILCTLLPASAYENGTNWSVDDRRIMRHKCIITRARVQRGHLPPCLDMDYLVHHIAILLSSHHIQLLLSTLRFIYNVLDLFDGPRRHTLISKILLHHHFFQLFLHWHHEVRHLFHHILIYRIFVCNRFHLPILTDHLLLSTASVLERKTHHRNNYITKAAFLLGVSPPQSTTTPSISTQSAKNNHSNNVQYPDAYNQLASWNLNKAVPGHLPRLSLFYLSLSLHDLSLDLCFASKLDAVLQMITQPPAPALPYAKQSHIYSQRAVSEYTTILLSYYDYQMHQIQSKNLLFTSSTSQDYLPAPAPPQLT